MKSIKLYFLILLSCSFCISVAVADDCKRNEKGFFDDINCAANSFARADKRLNEVYGELLSKLSYSEREKLKISQRIWLKYRKSTVDFIYTTEGDGSLGRLMVENYLEQQTENRIKELSSWLP